MKIALLSKFLQREIPTSLATLYLSPKYITRLKKDELIDHFIPNFE